MKTIFIGLNWLGDIIMSVPAIMAAAAAGEVHVVTRPHLSEFYQLLPANIITHPITTNGPVHDVLRAFKPLRALKADRVIALPDSWRAAILAKACSAGESIGFACQMRGLILDKTIDKPADFKQMHESDLHFMLVKEAGLAVAKPSLPIYQPDEQTLRQVTGKFGLSAGEDYMVLAPGAAFGSAKRWPPEKFAELARLISDSYQLPVVLTAGSNETALTRQICDEARGRLIDTAGQTSLVELACLLSGARALIANDSGTMHLAALCNTPTVVPVGPTDMVRTGPLNSRFAGVSTDICPQAPCRQRVCPRQDQICMQNISALAIFVELQKLTGTGND
ncbi:MAG: lipopolysaccharide heptosyltransferase II [Candidatus Riflebacteria bacterium GWC2_50_8]|nr:MAG: lipopolysaccharide heptosyltransferase II [Candidatus Riflebacteria bacterium GWC2_50_8]